MTILFYFKPLYRRAVAEELPNVLRTKRIRKGFRKVLVEVERDKRRKRREEEDLINLVLALDE